MLVLSRQRDETIMIGDEVELTIVDIRGDKVRVGIKAPAHVAVHRKEVYDAIRLENEHAAELTNDALGAVDGTVRSVAVTGGTRAARLSGSIDLPGARESA
ncbi:MAG: carbon storage regulator CsrA [Planctomycetota bacterium]